MQTYVVLIFLVNNQALILLGSEDLPAPIHTRSSHGENINYET